MQPVTPIPFLDLTAEFAELEAQWFAAIREVGRQGSFILGSNVTTFEQEVAAYVGARYAIAVANGTDALVLSLRAMNIGSGDEVITTPFTFFATSEAINQVGATPVFVDILADSFTIDPDAIRARINDRTRAIIPVHLFGCPAHMGEIMAIAQENSLVVIEDCAQAFGATSGQTRVGAIGDTGCFSFYPTKVLGCYGDGGMITTNIVETAEHLRRLRNHGAVAPFVHREIGYNSRLDEIQAALLRIKLRSIDQAIEARRQVAAQYTHLLQGTDVITPLTPAGHHHVFNLYTVRTRYRDQLREVLKQNGIGHSVCYPQPLHLQDVYQYLGYRPGDLPVAEQAAAEALSLPIYPGLQRDEIERVCGMLHKPLAPYKPVSRKST